jgi:hypothetical protein
MKGWIWDHWGSKRVCEVIRTAHAVLVLRLLLFLCIKACTSHGRPKNILATHWHPINCVDSFYPTATIRCYGSFHPTNTQTNKQTTNTRPE